MNDFLATVILITGISFSIIALRKDHPNNVYTLWYLFFFMTGFGFLIYYYLDASGLFVISNNQIKLIENFSAKEGIVERALVWFMDISTDFHSEMTMLCILLSMVILPQIFSFLVSGVFGCGRPPILVSSVTKFAFLSLVKFWCVLSALVMDWVFVSNI